MENAYEQAKRDAIKQVLLNIAETGNPTQAQIDFIKAFKPRPDELKELGEALKVMDSFLGLGVGK